MSAEDNGLGLPEEGFMQSRTWGRQTTKWFAWSLAIILWTAGASPARAQKDFSDQELVAAALEVYNEFATTPLPYLDSGQLDKLVDHRIVRVRKTRPSSDDKKGHREEVVGYRVIEQPRVRVWLAALDPEFDPSDLLTEVRLDQDAQGGSLWFQHLSLPWPVADRYWVIRLFKDLALAQKTRGFVWEHGWRLAENGQDIARKVVEEGKAGSLTVKDLEGAVYIPLNRGAWILFSLEPQRTLLAYRVSADVGGSIPESWIATFAMAQLDGLLDKVAAHSEVAWRDYDPQRYVIYDGEGQALARIPE